MIRACFEHSLHCGIKKILFFHYFFEVSRDTFLCMISIQFIRWIPFAKRKKKKKLLCKLLAYKLSKRISIYIFRCFLSEFFSCCSKINILCETNLNKQNKNTSSNTNLHLVWNVFWSHINQECMSVDKENNCQSSAICGKKQATIIAFVFNTYELMQLKMQNINQELFLRRYFAKQSPKTSSQSRQSFGSELYIDIRDSTSGLHFELKNITFVLKQSINWLRYY